MTQGQHHFGSVSRTKQASHWPGHHLHWLAGAVVGLTPPPPLLHSPHLIGYLRPTLALSQALSKVPCKRHGRADFGIPSEKYWRWQMARLRRILQAKKEIESLFLPYILFQSLSLLGLDFEVKPCFIFKAIPIHILMKCANPFNLSSFWKFKSYRNWRETFYFKNKDDRPHSIRSLLLKQSQTYRWFLIVNNGYTHA